MWSLRARLGPQPPDKCFTGSAWVWCVSRAARDTGQRRPRAARDTHPRVTVTRDSNARERSGAWWWGPQAGVQRASAFAVGDPEGRVGPLFVPATVRCVKENGKINLHATLCLLLRNDPLAIPSKPR